MYITRIEFFALFLSILGGMDLFVNRKCSVLKLKRFIPSGLASYVLRISESALVSVGRVDVSVGRAGPICQPPLRPILKCALFIKKARWTLLCETT